MGCQGTPQWMGRQEGIEEVRSQAPSLDHWGWTCQTWWVPLPASACACLGLNSKCACTP